jgi:hypothetical protein
VPNSEFLDQINLKYSGGNFFLIHDSNLNNKIYKNLTYLKNRGIPNIENDNDYRKRDDDGTRKTFAGQIITYYYNNDQNLELTHSVFNMYFNSEDKNRMWISIKELINSINANIELSKAIKNTITSLPADKYDALFEDALSHDNVNKKGEQLNLNKSPDYQRYCNSRYNYCIDYPDNLNPQHPSANNDGREFKDKAGNIVLTVYGTHHVDENGDPASLQALYQSELKRKSSSRVITYNKIGNEFYIISGTVNGNIFYQKTIQLSDGFGYAILEYSENKRSFYNIVATHLNSSFKAVP